MSQIWQCTISHIMAGVRIDNIVGVGTTSAMDANDVASAVSDAWASNVMPVLVNTLAMEQVTVIDLLSPTASGIASEGTTGGLTGLTPLPTFVCANVQLSTAFRGRSFRGRTGLSGLVENDTTAGDPNTITPARVDALRDAYYGYLGDVFTAVSSHGGFNGVISQVSGGAPRTPPIITPITAATVHPLLGTRRGRLT